MESQLSFVGQKPFLIVMGILLFLLFLGSPSMVFYDDSAQLIAWMLILVVLMAISNCYGIESTYIGSVTVAIGSVIVFIVKATYVLRGEYLWPIFDFDVTNYRLLIIPCLSFLWSVRQQRSLFWLKCSVAVAVLFELPFSHPSDFDGLAVGGLLLWIAGFAFWKRGDYSIRYWFFLVAVLWWDMAHHDIGHWEGGWSHATLDDQLWWKLDAYSNLLLIPGLIMSFRLMPHQNHNRTNHLPVQ